MRQTSSEIPIMLGPDRRLPYEDVAKLNAFYEEYKAFWDASSEAIISAPSSYASTESSRSISSISEIGQSLCALELSSPAPVISSQAAILEYEGPYKQPLSPMESYTNHCQRELSNLDHMNNPLCQVRSSHKKLFGENGWLGGTEGLRNLSSEKHKSKGLKDLRKKIIEGFAEGMARASLTISHKSRDMQGHLPQSSVPISLSPPVQAVLYSELEVMICVSANAFLVQQYKEGRLSGESIKKIKDFWGSKNRPQVVEFQFDQATQRRLISENKKSLRFHAESSTNPVLLSSNLHNWKAIVKEMSVRTFCAPDSVIRKHLHDVYKLLDMLGAPVATLVVFQKLHMRTLSLMGDHTTCLNFRPTNSRGKPRARGPTS
ncbi:hypothetical protein BDV23DRAFT_176147 [Aspergillus alliaceus]|uniref:Uncharacterized protein n=1 Tax=Petromyces alliaceus TaxID=209559 RepID=A0A5N7BUT7_PETAA|nr:hypothetical protein BDV23DRAFT_176147 [Aspergillus alliaceus]